MPHHAQPLSPGSAAERKMIFGSAAVALLLLILDQWTKILVEQHFFLGESVPLIPGCFALTFVTNHGAAWGMFSGHEILLSVFGLAVLALALIFLRRLTEGWAERILAVMMVISGIIGNSVDRLWRGAVVDFLDCYYHGWHWPAFNVADSAICVGIAVFVLSSLFRPEAPKKEPDAKPDAAGAPRP